MSKTFTVPLCVIALFLSSLSARAQTPLEPAEIRKISTLFDAPSSNSLKCYIEQWKPSLDFAFRFDAGYLVRCRFGIFQGAKSDITLYSRITPQGKAPQFVEDDFHLPVITPEMTGGVDPRKVKLEFSMSGAFGVGEGDYLVEVLAIDTLKRSCRRHWKLHIVRTRSERKVPLAIAPFTVSSLDRNSWIAPPPRGHGLRLTIFLDAAPMNPRAAALRAWDRAFLMESLYSLLRQMPCESVRVVAFNLEQQRELFRQDKFDAKGFIELSNKLREMETGTISVQALTKRNSPEFLAKLANHELGEEDPSDALVLLGPKTHTTAGSATSMLAAKKDGHPQVFYFEYVPWLDANFRDAVQQLTRDLDGKIYNVHSPAEFGQAIQKALAQLNKE